MQIKENNIRKNIRKEYILEKNLTSLMSKET